MKIGIIVANDYERDAFVKVFGKPEMSNLGFGAYEIFQWKPRGDRFIYLIVSGLGEIAAASATQYLIDMFDVDRIINFGVVGSLSEKYGAKTIGIASRIVHYDFDISFSSDYRVGEYPGKSIFLHPDKEAIPISATAGLYKFTCASADKIVGGGEPKRRLRRQFGADICEMEAAGIVLTCNRNKVPCTFVKVVSDGVDEDVEAFDNNVHEASEACAKLVKKFIAEI